MDKKVCTYVIHENQQENYVVLIDEQSVVRDMHMYFYVERNATLTAEILIAHVDATVTIECVLQGQGADARISGAYVAALSNKVQIITVQRHEAAQTRSVLVMKGMLRDNACAHYHGTIRVEKSAQGTVASQENKNILLSHNARAVSVPSLEVLNNEVQCFHGSATGRCDEEQLFYCATRGIDEKKAQQLLLNAFFANLFVSDELNNKVLELIG